MKNTFGQSISLTVFGESHGAGVGVVLDGLCSGLDVNDASIKNRAFSSRTLYVNGHRKTRKRRVSNPLGRVQRQDHGHSDLHFHTQRKH